MLDKGERDAIARGMGIVHDIRRRWPEHMPWKFVGDVMSCTARITLTDDEVQALDTMLMVLNKVLKTP